MNTGGPLPSSFVFGKDANAEQRSVFDEMYANMNSGMDASLLSNERGIGNAQQFVSPPMMSSGSNSGRGIPTATSDSIMRAVGEGMGKNLNDVMMQTQGIQNKYGDPNDKSIQQIMAEFNANESNTGILNKVSESKLRDEAIKQRIADKTFVPMKKAQAYEPPKQTVADRKGYTPKPVAKPKVKVNYNRNKPVAVKSKPSRTPTPKPTRTTGSRGGRGNVGARRRLTGGR